MTELQRNGSFFLVLRVRLLRAAPKNQKVPRYWHVAAGREQWRPEKQQAKREGEPLSKAVYHRPLPKALP